MDSSSKNWLVHEDAFEPARLRHSETKFTSGNGYLGTRGAFEETYPDEERATFIHGVFDDVPIVMTELANAPDWLELEIYLAGERFALTEGTLLAYQRLLDLRSGVLTRRVRWQSPQGRVVEINYERFASLADPHLLLIRFTVKAVDFHGRVEVRAGVSGSSDNQGLLHWVWQSQSTSLSNQMSGASGGSAGLLVRTRKTRLQTAVAFQLTVKAPGEVQAEDWDVTNHPTIVAAADLETGQTLVGEKLCSIYTGRDGAEPLQAARQALKAQSFPAWDRLYREQVKAWDAEWAACDVQVEGDDEAQLALRFNLFQLLIAAPRHDEWVNIGAKTLSGYGYRGHSFWDTEIFMLPFFTYTRPQIARSLLSYRWHNLPGARKKATGNGFRGAQFPWESAGAGEEVTPTWLPHQTDPKQQVRIWTGDIEIHISADIAFAIWQYWKASGDDAFLYERGAEVIFETARFWASRAEWDAEARRYEYNLVIGPDENHDRIDNNAYTNYLARWELRTAIQLLEDLGKTAPDVAAHWTQTLGITPAELAQWREVSDQIYCPYDLDSRMVEQFEGYFKCKNVTCADFEPRTLSVQALLGIDEAAATQIIKQPDVLMLFYLMPDLANGATLKANYDYYTPRTDQTLGSSLGPSIQSIMASRVGDGVTAIDNFRRAARADLFDVRGNAGDGIHGASAGGLWQAAVFGFGGLQFTDKGPLLKPSLPPGWQRLSFHFVYHGTRYLAVATPAGGEVQAVG